MYEGLEKMPASQVPDGSEVFVDRRFRADRLGIVVGREDKSYGPSLLIERADGTIKPYPFGGRQCLLVKRSSETRDQLVSRVMLKAADVLKKVALDTNNTSSRDLALATARMLKANV